MYEEGAWRTADRAHEYPVVDDIPCLVYPPDLLAEDSKWMAFYDRFAPFYAASERYLGRILTGVDVLQARAQVVEALPISPGESVLEVSPGPGVYQSLLAARLGAHGHLTALDLSQGMLRQCRRATRTQSPRPSLVRGNASYLPFLSHAFDGLFHFGGVNLFAEPARALEEFARVVKPDGWVAFGDESLSGEWRARSDWRSRLLRRMNPGYEKQPPPTPDALGLLEECVAFGGLAYLHICRVMAVDGES